MDQIRAGLESREFEPFFQPIVDLATGTLVGFEALARWRRPGQGVLLPAQFVGHAEACGLIRAIDMRVLDVAWRALDAVLAERPALPKRLVLSVNLSTEHLLDNVVADHLGALVAQGLGRSFRLQFEITETKLISNHEGAVHILDALRRLGVSIAVDDFGTGYSSLVYVHCLPIDCVKIDRSFSEGILRSERSRAIVAAIIGLARALQIRTVAEGVEESDVAKALLALGCQYGQGLLFGAPAPVSEVGALIDRMFTPRAAP